MSHTHHHHHHAPKLPAKENQLLKAVAKHYETRHYKKGLKAAETILKKFPNHGETLSMKGLTLNSLERKEEAYEYARRGLKQDLHSHVCQGWHVYGLLHRSDRDYNEAVKCYRNALRGDPDNFQILRDLSLLQIQLRDFAGYVETRRRLLVLRPQQKGNWLAFAVGTHLMGNRAEALRILDECEKSIQSPEKPDYESSELLLYRNSILEEMDIQTALDNLDTIESKVFDKLALREKRAAFLLTLNRPKEAETQFWELLRVNPDHLPSHLGLQRASGLAPKGLLEENSHPDGEGYSAEQVKGLEELYEKLAVEFPKADLVKRLPLNFLPAGETFKRHVNNYLIPKLRKGVPSLFKDMESLYNDKAKVTQIEEIVSQFLVTLKSDHKFEEKGQLESPAATLWTLFFLSQHFDALGMTAKALELINEAIVHTPTVIDLYTVKAGIYKHAGDIEQASRLYEKARKMDLADRYLNAKSVTYLLRADHVDEALQVVGLFTKEGEDPQVSLFDMQASWFHQELAESYIRQGNLGLGLKKLLAIDKFFQDIQEDQFDFHTYCLRKMTFRSYVDMIRFEDHLREHPFYRRAAHQLIKTYLHLHDFPYVSEKKREEERLAKMEPAERKNYLAKKKKEELRKAREAEEKTKKETSSKKKTPVDLDPEGKKLLEADPLKEAAKFVRVLQTDAPNDLQTHLLATELFMREKKHLLVLQSLNRANKINPNDPSLHVLKLKFFRESKTAFHDSLAVISDKDLHPKVKEVLETARDNKGEDSLFGGQSLDEYNLKFLERNSSSIAHRHAAGEGMWILTRATDKALATMSNIEGAKGHNCLKDAIGVYNTIANVLKEEKAAEQFKVNCKNTFPEATFFMDPQERDARSEQQKKESEEKEGTPEQSTKA